MRELAEIEEGEEGEGEEEEKKTSLAYKYTMIYPYTSMNNKR